MSTRADSATHMFNTGMPRRSVLALLGAPWVAAVSGCDRPEDPNERLNSFTPEQLLVEAQRQRAVARFGDIGAGLIVDAMKGQELDGVNFYYEGTTISLYSTSRQTVVNRSTEGIPFAPDRLRIVWRDTDALEGNKHNILVPVGRIIGDETIEVATRIPQALVDDLKRDPKGGLRLKFRMSQQGTYFERDIVRRPGYDPKNRDQWGEAVYVGPEHSFVGGDFREAKIYNGRPERMGWYIDKKTGERIETDY